MYSFSLLRNRLKMKKLLFIISIVLVTACHHKELSNASNTSKTNATTTVPTNPPNGIKEVVVDANAKMYDTGTNYKVDSLEINNDTLSVFVAYSGGCKEHSWELVTNGMYEKTRPPEITVCLKHISNGDACRQIIRNEVKFNITKLKYSKRKEVVVILGKYEVNYVPK
jgi:hypothetical protein